MVSSYQLRIAAGASLGIEALLPKTIRPQSGTVKLTERCNSRCITCGLWKKQTEDFISTDRAVELIREFHSLGIRRLVFTGGETLLRQDFFEILNTLHPGQFEEVTLRTNGLLLKRYAEQINESAITQVCVSLDGGPSNDDRIRGVQGHYGLALEGLSNLRNKMIHICSTLTASSGDDLEDLIKLCRDRNYTFSVNLLETRVPFFSDEETKAAVASIWPDPASAAKIIYILEKYDVLNEQLLKNAWLYFRTKELLVKRCILAYVNLIVSSNGDISPGCYILPAVGNILTQSIRNILDSQEFSQMALRMFHLQCPRCTSSYVTSLYYQHPWQHIGKVVSKLRSREDALHLHQSRA